MGSDNASIEKLTISVDRRRVNPAVPVTDALGLVPMVPGSAFDLPASTRYREDLSHPARGLERRPDSRRSNATFRRSIRSAVR